MNHNVRRYTIAAILLLSLALLMAACQRERPSPEAREGWTVSPLPEETVTVTQQPLQAASPAPSTTTLAVVEGPPVATQPAATIQPIEQPTTAILQPVGTPEGGVVVPAGPTFTYVVVPGDTLFSIALIYDTDVETLRQLNNLPDDTIAVGQTLLVPGTGDQEQPSTQPGQQPGATGEPVDQVIYIVQQGDTLSDIAAGLGVDWQQVAAYNGIEGPNYNIFRGQRLVIPGVTPTPLPTAEVTIHVVQSGDTLYGIAIQYGVTLQALLAANGITNPDQLTIGQELVIPE